MVDGSRGAASESKVEVEIDFFTVLEDLCPTAGEVVTRSSSPSSLMGGFPKRLKPNRVMLFDGPRFFFLFRRERPMLEWRERVSASVSVSTSWRRRSRSGREEFCEEGWSLWCVREAKLRHERQGANAALTESDQENSAMELDVVSVKPARDSRRTLIGSGPTARPVPGPATLFCIAGDFCRILVPLYRPGCHLIPPAHVID